VTAEVVAGVLVVVLTAYAVLGGADFGGGLWDLLAGGTRRGAAPRALIDRSVGPVWEANHVWLIIALVVLWTCFPAAFATVFTALFVPLSLAAFGVVLRGAGFAFRAQVRRLRAEAVAGGVFALSSLLTPFFMGAVIGAIAAGHAGPDGRLAASWTGPTALLTGALFVAAAAYLAATFLTVEAGRAGDAGLRRYFLRRAVLAGLAAGVLAGATMLVLRATAPTLAGRLLAGPALPLVALSVLAGLAVLVLLVRGVTVGVRPVAATAAVAVVWGWAVAQYPDLLPGLPIAAAAAPTPALVAELVVAGAVLVLVVPSFALLFVLAQRGRLAEDGVTSADGLADRDGGGR
jgi:cytochrome bd ubiquinol oxidase subunit II